MKRNLVPAPSAKAIPAVFDFLGVSNVTPNDKFSIEYAAGFVTATVNRKDGGTEVVRKHIKGGFTEATSYDPALMDRQKRNEVIHQLRDDGFTQSQIARRIGFTQATVSNVLRKPK
jgi:DNA-binding NarL/FixJ family response regulator